MKSKTSEDFKKNQSQLQKDINEEEVSLRKLGVAISLGREKKIHLVRLTRKKIATLKTLLTQKKFLEEVS